MKNIAMDNLYEEHSHGQLIFRTLPWTTYIKNIAMDNLYERALPWTTYIKQHCHGQHI